MDFQEGLCWAYDMRGCHSESGGELDIDEVYAERKARATRPYDENYIIATYL